MMLLSYQSDLLHKDASVRASCGSVPFRAILFQFMVFLQLHIHLSNIFYTIFYRNQGSGINDTIKISWSHQHRDRLDKREDGVWIQDQRWCWVSLMIVPTSTSSSSSHQATNVHQHVPLPSPEGCGLVSCHHLQPHHPGSVLAGAMGRRLGGQWVVAVTTSTTTLTSIANNNNDGAEKCSPTTSAAFGYARKRPRPWLNAARWAHLTSHPYPSSACAWIVDTRTLESQLRTSEGNQS